MTNDEMLIESIEQPLRNEFGTPDPAHPDWVSTRPGFHPGERLAYVRVVEGEDKSFISIVEHEEGREDENGYVWDNDGYEVVISRKDGTQDREVLQNTRKVAEAVAEEMENES